MKKNYEVRETQNKSDDTEIQVVFNGEVVFEWNDCAHIDYPEDLIWSRALSEIFDAGVKLGIRIAGGESTLEGQGDG